MKFTKLIQFFANMYAAATAPAQEKKEEIEIHPLVADIFGKKKVKFYSKKAKNVVERNTSGKYFIKESGHNTLVLFEDTDCDGQLKSFIIENLVSAE